MTNSTQYKPVLITESDAGQRLDRWLQQKYPGVGYPIIQKALRKGEIRLDGKRVEGKARLEEGMQLRLPPVLHHASVPIAERDLTPAEKKFVRSLVVYEDDAIIALNKPSGLATQGGSKTMRHVDRLLGAWRNKDGEKAKLVHRLDKDTSGILLVAKNRAAAASLGHMLKHRDVRKTYLAMTVDVPRAHEGEIKHALLKVEGGVIVDRENGKAASTLYKVLSYSGREVALVALRPETGRMHQLRVHMAHIHTPILGDVKYGGMAEHSFTETAAQERLWLHALCVHFTHPVTGKTMSLTAPVPLEMRAHLDEWNMAYPGVTDTNTPFDPMDRVFKL